jgi:Flp pilus assembly protein TadD
MSKIYQTVIDKIRRGIGRSVQKTAGEGGENLSGQSALKIGVFATNGRIGLLACLIVIVCAAVVATHWSALSAEAMMFDDEQYLSMNPLVQNPSWASVRQFLTEVLEPSTVEGYYQPLTMISLMVDYALGGRDDNLMPFHRTSIALHAANTALVIVLLYLLFGQAWIAAGVGLLFGLHPMTVETISWVGERKTLLAAFFTLWCLILYVRFVRRNKQWTYIICLLMYVLALMSKPTSIMLPVLMLVLDYWPLGRWKKEAIEEKMLFFVVGGIFAVITFVSQRRTAIAVVPGLQSLNGILLTLCHNIIFYLYKIVWPANLSPYYPYPEPLGLSKPMVLAGVIGTCILAHLLVTTLRWTRGVLAGWLFFFLAILPTMGVIRFSIVIAANKFAYLPSTGLLMIVVLLLGWFCRGVGKMIMVRRITAVIAVVILAGAEAVATRRHLAHWHSTAGLYEYMLALAPNAAPLHVGLGLALEKRGSRDEAISHYRRALELKSDYAIAHNNLGNALLAEGELDEAIRHYRWVLQSSPDQPEAYNNLGFALAKKGRFEDAISYYKKALEIEPGYVTALKGIAWILATNPDPKVRDADRAVKFAERAAKLTGHQNATVLDTLAAAYAADGRFEQAVTTAQAAFEQASAGQDRELAGEIQRRLELYSQKKPYQEPSQQQEEIRR